MIADGFVQREAAPVVIEAFVGLSEQLESITDVPEHPRLHRGIAESRHRTKRVAITLQSLRVVAVLVSQHAHVRFAIGLRPLIAGGATYGETRIEHLLTLRVVAYVR